jgi:hypothetical protein
MSRPPRIARTTSNLWRRDLACGIDPAGALSRALAELHAVRAGQVWSVGIGHDDGCPALSGRSMSSCTCELVRLDARRAA